MSQNEKVVQLHPVSGKYFLGYCCLTSDGRMFELEEGRDREWTEMPLPKLRHWVDGLKEHENITAPLGQSSY